MEQSKQNIHESQTELKKSKSAILESRVHLKAKSKSKIQSKAALLAETKITVNDTTDPSYTNLVLPYRVICRHRYHKSGVLQRLQFIREIKAHELLQNLALDGVRIHRIFCDTVLCPLNAEDFIKPTIAQQMRIEDILITTLKLYCGSNPLTLWDKQVKNGHIRRVVDEEVKSLVLDISGTNVATTYITCPIQPRASLGVKLPFLVMVIKNMKRYFSFEIQILDDKDMRRRFRVSNFQSTTKVRPFCTTMPIGLNSGWNQVQFNLADFTKRAYGSIYMETVRVQVHANVRIRRIYFSDALYSDDDLPNDFKLFAPSDKTKDKKGKEDDKAEGSPDSGKPPDEAPPPPTPADDNLTAKAEGEEGEPPVPSPVEASEAGEPTEEAPTEGESPPPQEGEGGEVAHAEGDAPPAEGGEAAEGAPAEGEAPAEAPPEEAPAEAEAPPAEAAPEEAPAEPPPE